MALITRPQILLHSYSCSSSHLLRFPNLSAIPTRRRSFPSAVKANSTTTTTTPPPQQPGSISIINDLLDYLNESWTHFHATAEAKRQLLAAGFELLNENEQWDLKPGGRYFFTRNMSSLLAFAVGENYQLGGNGGFHAIAAHTDSPCLKLKPKTASSKGSYLMLNVQTYGGGLWHTWFDRDLSVAGRVILRNRSGGGDGDGNCFLHKLVKVQKPILRIPTLAIHLDRYIVNSTFYHSSHSYHSILAPFGRAYWSLSDSISSYVNVWESLCKQLMACHKLQAITYGLP